MALRSVDASVVSVRLLLPPGVDAYAAEERVGAEPSVISDGGTHDAAAGVVRWGPLVDGQPRMLTYRIGTSSLVRLPVGPRLSHIGDNGDGVMQVVVEDDPFSGTSAHELETSTDLRTWRSGGTLVNGPSAAFIRDDASATDGPRCYRAKRVR